MANEELHFVLIPLMAQGHIIPMVDIARMLAERGVSITIITTPLNASRFKSVVARARESKLQIEMLELSLPSTKVGLPEGCETFDMLPSADLALKFFEAASMLQEPVVFHGPGCFFLFSMYSLVTSGIINEMASDTEPFVVPCLPDRVELTKAKAGKVMSGMDGFLVKIKESEEKALGVVVNTFEELEPEYFNEYVKVKGKPVWCIGPVSLYNKNNLDKVERGNKTAIDEHQCLKWLDSREPSSVIYFCLGRLP